MQRAMLSRASPCIASRRVAVVASTTARRAFAVVTSAASSPFSMAPLSLVAPACQRRFVLSDAMKGMNKTVLSDASIDAAIFRRMSESDFQAVDRIYNAYLEYFNHIKFRKEWDKPKYVQSEIDPMLREAAEYAFRVRQYLDLGKVEAETTLRQIDGEAQKFLHSETGPRLAKSDQSAFVAHLLHATMSDARGYVEGLSESSLNRLVARLQRHRFSPAEHLRHVLLEGLEVLNTAAVEPISPSEPLHYVDDNSPEDKAWRAAIASSYDAAESAATALQRRASTAAASAEALAKEGPPKTPSEKEAPVTPEA